MFMIALALMLSLSAAIDSEPCLNGCYEDYYHPELYQHEQTRPPTASPVSSPTLSPTPSPTQPPTEEPKTPTQCSFDPVMTVDVFDLSNAAYLETLMDGSVLARNPAFTMAASITGHDKVGSVQFILDGNVVRVENVGPFIIGGDTDGILNPFPIDLGPHTLDVHVFSGSRLSGSRIETRTYSFTVVETTTSNYLARACIAADKKGSTPFSTAPVPAPAPAPAPAPVPPLVPNGLTQSTIRTTTVIDGARSAIKLNGREGVLIKNAVITDQPTVNGVELINCRNIVVLNCVFENVRTGVYAVSSSNIQVIDSRFKNMQGPMPRGQMVQFNKVTGSKNWIVGNMIHNELGKSMAEDAVNLYKTHGEPDGYVIVERNFVWGGGPSKSGGGLLAGDNGGSYQIIRNNIVVDPGQYGIACAGGENIIIEGNEVYGKQQSFTNVGIYAWKQRAPTAKNVRIADNKVHWKNSRGVDNVFWDGGNIENLEVSGIQRMDYSPPPYRYID